MIKKYHEVEVFVHAQYRHKFVIETNCENIAKKEAIKQLISEPLSYWCDKDFLECWENDPRLENEIDQFEICGIWDCSSDYER